MKTSFWLLVLILLLTACQPAVSTPAISTPTLPPLPTTTPTPTVTPTITPITIRGTLFFDMNGSGLRDNATFIYDSSRLTDEKQPLHPDLKKAVEAYLVDNPEIVDGDLISIEEPGLSNFRVCADEICSTSDSGGFFSMTINAKTKKLVITDPFSKNPEFKMRFIQQWISSQDFESKTIENIKIDEQHLNLTKLMNIDEGVAFTKNQEIVLGLSQGFLTMPFQPSTWFFTYNWVDLDPEKDRVLNYEGLTRLARERVDVPNSPLAIGDGHDAIDYAISYGTIVYAAAPGKVENIYQLSEGNGGIQIITRIGNKEFTINYGHMEFFFVKVNENVYRGQAIAATGPINELHFQLLTKDDEEPCRYFGHPTRPDDYHPDSFYRLDPYRDTGNPSCFSFWIVDNSPMFP